ncbi:hypothetical protein ACOMHN_016240 [Nucella lapillus]
MSLVIYNYNKDSVVKELLLHPFADINVRDRHYNTPLHVAVCHDCGDAVKTLLENDADVNIRDDIGQTPLHKAIMLGHLNVLEVLLQREPDIYAEARGFTPLHSACFCNNTQAARTLIDHGAPLNTNAQEGWTPTPLHSAHQEGHEKIVKLLLAAEANVNAVTGNRRTPLCLASACGRREIVRLLLDHDAKVDLTDTCDPLEAAAVAGHHQIAQMLTDHLSNVYTTHGVFSTLGEYLEH